MKKKVMAMLLVLMMLVMPAAGFAAEEAPASVGIQINGASMYFAEGEDDPWAELFRYVSDVPPVVKADRVYIPFRTVIASLGSDVSYDADSQTITANTANGTIVFQEGADSYLLKDKKVKFDNAAFVQDGYTYVPVRFACEAMGADVGWDAANRTVIVLEKDKFTEQLRGEFTLLERYVNDTAFAPGSNVKAEGTLRFAMNMKTFDNETGEVAQEIPVAVTIDTSALSSNAKVNLDAAVALDIDKLLTILASEEDADLMMLTLLEYFQQFNVSYIADLEKGNLYLKSEVFALIFGGEADTWYSIRLDDYIEDAEYDAYLKLVKEAVQAETAADMEAVITELIEEIPMEDAYAVSSNLQALEMIYDLFADDNFERTADGYINEMWDDIFYTKVMFPEQNGKLVGMNFAMESRDVAEESLGGSIKMHMNQLRNMYTLNMKLNMGSQLGEYLTMQVDGKWVYSASADAPLAAPQDGETVVNFITMLEAMEQAV